MVPLLRVGRLLAALSVTSLAVARSVPHEVDIRRPNILFILADDQGYGDFSSFGNRILKTPRLDQLRSQSTTLTQVVMAPVCAPTRAGLMTGRYHYRTGVWDTWKSRCHMYGDETTVAEVLRDAGYHTGLIGKWHLGYEAPMRPIDQGFLTTVTWEEYAKDHETRLDPVLRINAGTAQEHPGFLEDVFFDAAADYLQERKRDGRPFFLHYASFLPHDVDQPTVPARYKEPFEGLGLSPHTVDVYGMVAKLDETVGRLLDALDRLGLADNTIVIYTSDNGAQASGRSDREAAHKPRPRYNHGLRGNKGSVYDGGILLPTFVRHPATIAPGRTISDQAAYIDFFPTILDFAGVPPPAGVEIDGLSLRPALTQGVALPERNLIIDFHRTEVPQPFANACVRGPRYKLVGGDELYDLLLDPGEQVNLATSHPEIVGQLRDEYLAWFAKTKGERGFQPAHSHIGSPAQTEVVLQFFNQTEHGWPVEVLEEGPYQIIVENFDRSLFPEGARLLLSWSGRTWTIDPFANGTGFRDIKLTPGRGWLQVETSGYKLRRMGRWNEEDRGFRNIAITRSPPAPPR